jgi:hypothetical protein
MAFSTIDLALPSWELLKEQNRILTRAFKHAASSWVDWPVDVLQLPQKSFSAREHWHIML